MKPPRPPVIPLADLETILCEVDEMLARFQGTAEAGALDGRIVQCRSAIAACRRHQFSPPLLRALAAKVLEVETDALVVRRTLRFAARDAGAAEKVGRAKRGRKDRRRHR
jgi:hypothetical protein